MNAQTQITAAPHQAEHARIARMIEKATAHANALGTRNEDFARAVAADAASHVYPDAECLIEERDNALELCGMFTEDNWPEDNFGNRASSDGLYIPLPRIEAEVV